MFEFITEGMTCSKCIQHVTSAVKAIDPKAKINVLLEEQKVLVESDSNRDMLASAIREAGYPVQKSRAVSPRTS